MHVSFGSPAALWLLLLAPLVWLALRIGRTGFVLRQKRWQAATRSLILICLTLALARPVVAVSSSRTAIVYLVDVSHSIASRAVTSAASTIDTLNSTLKPAESRILAFAGNAVPIADTAALRKLGADTDDSPSDDALARESTNTAEALAAARAEVPPGTNGRIVLFSDGNDTDGDSRAMADRLAAEHIPVFVEPSAVRDIGDTWIDDVRVDGSAVAHGVTSVDVVVRAQQAGRATVTLKEGAKPLGSRTVALEVGRTSIPIDVTFELAGPHLIDATVDAENDALPVNNTRSHEVDVLPQPRVLYAATPGAPAVLPRALAHEGLDVTTMAPESLPKSVDGFEPWDAVVLSDVARSAIPNPSLGALSTWVESRGGGLFFAGGGAVFGEGANGAATGYRNTDLERVLPVTFEREDSPEVALVIVLDRSWSMMGPKIELCKSAADAAVNTLSDAQIIGVITFNNEYEWNVPLGTVKDNRTAIHEAISQITPSGPTLIYPALEQAYLALRAVRARAKHVVLLSDGQTQPDDYEGLVRKMADAKITVSSVALGTDADTALLGDLANWGKGRAYVVADPTELPQIFVKEAQNATTPGFEKNGSMVPQVHQASLFHGPASGTLPALHGRNTVTPKPEALDVVSTAQGDPLLTMWPVGLGRTAMFAADVDGGWTSDWLAWRGYGAFFASIVRAVARDRTPPMSLAVTAGARQGTARNLTVSLEARDAAGRYRDLLSPSVEVRGGNGTRATVALPQVAPGRYEANVTADASLPLTFRLEGPDATDETARIVATDTAAEYRFNPPDEAHLEALARATGGVMKATADDIRHATQAAGSTPYALAPGLLIGALLLWLADIALRRVRL